MLWPDPARITIRSMDAPTLPYTVVVPTVYGQMLLNRNDIHQTNPLFKVGVSPDHGEIVLLAQLLQVLGGRGLVALDIGANFGVFTLTLARGVGPGGVVHAFEPQRIIHQMLAGSIALNSLSNIHCHHLALGRTIGQVEVPQFDYGRPMNFGGVEFSAEQNEPLEQQRKHDPTALEHVRMATLDSLNLPRVDLIKLDVEGMENDVLDGAAETLQRCRPVLYIEFHKVDKDQLRRRLVAMNYEVHVAFLINYLCVPVEKSSLIKVSAPQAAAR